jgi:hypothetical protein
LTSAAWAQQSPAAQQSSATQANSAAQAKTPGAATTQNAPEQGAATGELVNGQAAGMIFGSVSDSDGDLIPGAQVTLTSTDVKGDRTVVSDSGGRFQFSGVAAGAFQIKATAQGMSEGTISGTLEPGAVYNAPAVKLQATSSTVITVRPQTEHQIAQQEVKVEESQRVLGIVPNYFVTYDKHPVPLDSKQKFSLGFHEVLDPTSFLFAGAAAGIEQAANIFPGYGSGPAAYGKRYGASLAGETTGVMFRDSIYPSLFHQDPRYYYKGTGTKWQRFEYAMATAVICKGDNQQWQANYSGILGSLTSGALANLYYAPSDRHGASLTFVNAGLNILGTGFLHVMQEFVFRDVTSHSHGAGTQP